VGNNDDRGNDKNNRGDGDNDRGDGNDYDGGDDDSDSCNGNMIGDYENDGDEALLFIVHATAAKTFIHFHWIGIVMGGMTNGVVTVACAVAFGGDVKVVLLRAIDGCITAHCGHSETLTVSYSSSDAIGYCIISNIFRKTTINLQMAPLEYMLRVNDMTKHPLQYRTIFGITSTDGRGQPHKARCSLPWQEPKKISFDLAPHYGSHET